MKYKLTQEAIEELKAMEFHTPRSMFVMEGMGDMRRILAGEWIFEEIKPKLPKPVLRSVEDLKALEGWMLYSASNLLITENSIEWSELDHKHVFDNCDTFGYEICQIDMPENTYLVSNCIEQEIEVGDLFEWKFRGAKEFFVAKKNEGGIIRVINGTTCQTENCKLIRKASEITAEDRERYLGEKAEAKEPISIADYQAHKDREFEAKVREIIKKVLKEEAGE